MLATQQCFLRLFYDAGTCLPLDGLKILTIYCRILKRELSKNIFECESDQQFEAVLDHLDRIAEFCDQEVKTLPNNVGPNRML